MRVFYDPLRVVGTCQAITCRAAARAVARRKQKPMGLVITVEAEDLEELEDAAEREMYRARRACTNRVSVVRED